MGPTNSGKTMNSIRDLLKATDGLYCAPLRLLAWEIYEKLESEGKSTSLLTGEERIENPDNEVTSCTIEMTNFKKEYDVAVIDEIQMIADK